MIIEIVQLKHFVHCIQHSLFLSPAQISRTEFLQQISLDRMAGWHENKIIINRCPQPKIHSGLGSLPAAILIQGQIPFSLQMNSTGAEPKTTSFGRSRISCRIVELSPAPTGEMHWGSISTD